MPICHDRKPEMWKDIGLLRRAAEIEGRRTRWRVQSSDGGERSSQGSSNVVSLLFTAFWLKLDTNHSELLWLKKARIIQSITNEALFFFMVYHPFPSCSLSSLCLRASSFIIRATLWEAIREKLTQLPASLSRLQPHQASPLPAVTRMASHYDGSGLASCKIFIDAPLGPWELCTNTLTHSQTHLHTGNSQRQLNVDHRSSTYKRTCLFGYYCNCDLWLYNLSYINSHINLRHSNLLRLSALKKTALRFSVV